MKDQFFGRQFVYAIAGMALLYLSSAIIYAYGGESVAIIIIFTATFLLALWRLEYGLFVAFAEIFSGCVRCYLSLL